MHFVRQVGCLNQAVRENVSIDLPFAVRLRLHSNRIGRDINSDRILDRKERCKRLEIDRDLVGVAIGGDLDDTFVEGCLADVAGERLAKLRRALTVDCLRMGRHAECSRRQNWKNKTH